MKIVCGLTLSPGFVPIEYIEGNGNQTIEIPTTYNCDYFEFCAQYTIANAEMCIVGNQDGGSANRWELFCDSSRPYFNLWTAYNSQSTTAGTTSALLKTVVSYDYNTHIMKTEGGTDISKTLVVQPRYIFHYGGGNYKAKAKLYYFLEKRGKLTVAKLIPVKRTSDDKIGLFDLVNQNFYPSETATDFTGGNVIKRKSQKFNATIGSFDGNLPKEYQELEYLQSTGTQFIELPFGFERTDKVYFDMSVDTGQTSDKYMISPKTWNNNNNRFAMGVHSSKFTCGFGNSSTGYTALVPNTTTDGKRHKWLYENSVFTIKDLGISYNGSSLSFGGVTANLKLFYGYNANTNGKIYEYIHWKNNSKIIHLVPCKRKSDNVLGLFDLINRKFYTNGGTGTFTAGPNSKKNTLFKPADAVIQLEDLANTNGAQYIEIPFMPDCSKGFKFEFGFIPTATGKRYALMSNYNVGSYQLSLEINASNKLRLWLNTGNLDKASSNSFVVNQLNIGTFEFKNNTYKITLNGTETSGSYTCSYKSTTTTMYAYLDKAKRTSTFPTPIKFTYIKIWEADRLIYDLVPFKKRNGNAYINGMINLLDYKKYYKKGTGSFTEGNNKKVIVY